MQVSVIIIDLRKSGQGDVKSLAPYVLPRAQDLTGQELEKKLLAFYQDIKFKAISRVRYVIILPTRPESELNLPVMFEMFMNLHRDGISPPFETEVFILLPSISADRAIKAKCYHSFETLENVPQAHRPDFLWLFDTDRFSENLLDTLLSTYLSTNAYRTFNSGYLAGEDGRKQLNYSSFGLIEFFFPAEKWQEYLSAMLVNDLLASDRLRPLSVNSDTARTASSQIFPFLQDKLAKIEAEITKPAAFQEADILHEGLAAGEREGLEKFFVRLKHYINQEKAKRWEYIQSDIRNFKQEVIREVESYLDESPRGLHSAWGFLGLVLNSGGPYIDYFKNSLAQMDTTDGVSLQSFLFGWQGKKSSPVLEILFREITNEIRMFYQSHYLTFPEPKTWEYLYGELSRLLGLSDLEKLLSAREIKFIENLKDKIETITEGIQSPHTLPFSEQDLEDILFLIEGQVRERLKKMLAEAEGVKEKYLEMVEKTETLGWKKILPFFWPLLLEKWSWKFQLESIRKKLKGAYLQVLKRRKRLFPCYFAPFVSENLFDSLEPLENEIKDFISLIEEHKSFVENKIQNMDFNVPPFATHIIETEEEIRSVYYSQLRPENVPKHLD